MDGYNLAAGILGIVVMGLSFLRFHLVAKKRMWDGLDRRMDEIEKRIARLRL